MTEQEHEDQGIVVDENWKEQVAREKAAARRAARNSQGESPRDFPPASFALLVSSFSTQALVALGLYPDPVSGKPKPDRALARHLIDMLGVIEEISRGNLREDDRIMLENVLHQLRMAFISAPNQGQPESPIITP